MYNNNRFATNTPITPAKQTFPTAQTPQPAVQQQETQAAPTGVFVSYSSINYYDNRGTLDRNGREQNTQAWDIRFNQEEAIFLLAQLQAAIEEGQGRGVSFRLTTGTRGNQKYESGGFMIRGKKEKTNAPGLKTAWKR